MLHLLEKNQIQLYYECRNKIYILLGGGVHDQLNNVIFSRYLVFGTVVKTNSLKKAHIHIFNNFRGNGGSDLPIAINFSSFKEKN